MTVRELRGMLSSFPEQMPVTARMDLDTSVMDPTGDRIIGHISGYFDIGAVKPDREFVAGTGFLPVAALHLRDEGSIPPMK